MFFEWKKKFELQYQTENKNETGLPFKNNSESKTKDCKRHDTNPNLTAQTDVKNKPWFVFVRETTTFWRIRL